MVIIFLLKYLLKNNVNVCICHMWGCLQRPEDGCQIPSRHGQLRDAWYGYRNPTPGFSKNIKCSKACMVTIFHASLWRASSTPKHGYHFPWVSMKIIKCSKPWLPFSMSLRRASSTLKHSYHFPCVFMKSIKYSKAQLSFSMCLYEEHQELHNHCLQDPFTQM